MATTLNTFKIDDLGMSFKRTVVGHSSIQYVYMQVIRIFFHLPPPCSHMCPFSVILPLSIIINIPYKISFHIKIYIKVFYIQISFKCEVSLFFFSNEKLQKIYKKFTKFFTKNMKKFLNYMFYTHDVTCNLSR